MALLLKKEEVQFKLGIWKIEEDLDFFEQQISFRSKIVHSGRQKQQLATRYLLFQLHHDFPFEAIQKNQAGKPFLPDDELQFNLSHSAELGAAILSKSNQVGIDVEKISPRVLKVKSKFLSDEEMKNVVGKNETEHVSLLTKYWTIKEAVYKWWGKGGIDFANHIKIKRNALFEEQVVVRYEKQNDVELLVNCFQLEEHWVAYVIK